MKLNTRNKRIGLVAGILVLAVLIIGVIKIWPSIGLKEGVVATVNGKEISEDEYNKLLDYCLSGLRVKHNLEDDELNKDIGGGMTFLDSLKSDILEALIENEIIAEEALKNDIEVDEAEIQELYEESYVKPMEEDEDYKKIIEESKIDEDFMKNQTKKVLLGHKYREFYLDKTKITDETARTFYNENNEMFHMEQVKAKHILVEEEQTAKDIIEKLENGEDFEELAKKHSIEPEAEETGGDLGYFSQNADLVPEFKEAAFALEVGKISRPVKTEFGYHVIVVDDKKDETIKFEDAKESIKHSLKESDFQNHMGEVFENAKVVKRDNL